MKNTEKITRGNRYVSWILRGFLLLVALFFMLFSFDVFTEDKTFWQKTAAFLIHNVFAFFMLFVLYIAWKRENIARLLLFLMGIIMVFFFGGPTVIREGTWIMISLPFICGTLFITNYYLIKNNSDAK